MGAAFVTAAAFGFRTVASALEPAADAQTMSDYSWSLGNKSSTQYNGRVWTDKSVSTEDVKFTGDAGETVTVPIGEGNDASDFLVTYSALATSQQVSGESNVPVDVVFVIDLSGSMSNSNSFMDNGQRRIQNLVTALNTAVNELMEMNPDNRIGVVGYESTAMTILPLDHYTPSGYNQNIFRYSDRNNRLSWDATNSSNQRVNGNTNVSGGTNTQMGIYQGMNMLATEADTTVTLAGGQEVNRVPSVIVMADGFATFSSDSSAWWSPSNNDNNGPGDDAYYGNGMKAMMTAAYMKQAIDRHYQPTDDAYKATVYTIGIGTDYLRGDDKNLAYITLNPKDHWNDDNSMANSIRNKWNGVDSEWGEWFDEEGYLSNNGTGTPDIDVDSRETYTLTHPQQNDITEVGLQYNDAYYDAITAEDINTIFADIVDSISLGTPQVPTKVEGSNPVESGYITYTDVIGDYMEVDSVKTLLWAGQRFDNPQVSGQGTDDVTYTFEGEIQNPAYENAQNANQIQITVHTNTAADGTKTQTLTVKIPATAIPLRVNTVELSENAQGETTVVNTSNNAYPLRLVYGVSLQEGIDPTTLEGVSDDYIKANTQDGKVNFYSNKYTGQKKGGKTVGDAKVEFTPADNNPFYFLQEDTPIYTSPTDNNRVERDDFDENATYWVPITYYDGNQIVNTRVARAASTMTGYIGYEEGDNFWDPDYVYIRAGAPRLGNLTDVVRDKSANTTNTAETSLYPTFEGDDVHNGKFVVYLGNNGKLQLDAPASLIIAKDVTADEGLTAPGATFTFEVTSAAKANSAVSATITTGSGQTATTEDKTVQFNTDGVATVTLKADQSIELKGMAGADYSIKETNLPSGFDFVKVEGADQTTGSGNDTVASGTVQTGADDETVTFTNNYSVTSVTSEDLNIDLGGTKTITGRAFQEDDTFTFTISAGQLTPDAPLPSATGGENSVTIKPNSGNSETFEFDPITFTEPGEYCYIIRETDPTAGGTNPEAGLGGVDYDTAVYRISVVIVDNGDGTLRLAKTDEIAGMKTQVENYTSNPMIQVLEGIGMTGVEAIQFDNSYNSESTTATIQGMKVLNVTNSDYRLQDGDFTFKIEALGSNTDGGDQFAADETQPMPVDQNGDELTQTTNVANGNVRFDFAEDVFTQDMVGKTFGYKITEVNPSPEGSIMSNGVSYDTSEKIVKITVADDGQGNVIAQVTPNTAAEGNPAVNFTFTNSYEPEEITIGDQTNAGITVQKTFTGHEWTDDYNFEYTLKAVSNTAGIETDKMPMPGETTLSIANPVSGSVNKNAFGEMTFERAGEYVYEITETNDGHGGVTYDDHTATVKVVVSENEETGKLSAIIQYDNSTASEADKNVEDAAAFTNTYDATFDTDTAVNLDGTKNLTVGGNSSRTLGAGQFYAVVAALDGAPLGDAAVAPGTTTYNIANTADDSADNGVFTGSFEDLLNNITFELSDLKGAASRDFVYLISEQQGNATGVKYDQSVYQVTVSVTDDGKGTLSADEPQIVKGTMQDGQFVANESQDGVNGVVFNNSYKPTSTTYAPLKITKVLSGDRNTGLQQGEFSFEMSVTSADPQDGITLPQQTVVENSADGSVQFGNITFTKAGTYVVQVKEVVPAEDSDERVPGVTYDEHVISRTFTVGDVDGELVVRVTNSTGSTTFTNKYTSTGTTDAALSGTKYISGRDFMKGDTFTFDITGKYEGTAENVTAPLPENVTASEDNAAQGTIAITPESGSSQAIDFGNITFTKPGTYTYTVSEQDIASSVKNVTKDSTVYTVTYTVTDDGDGTMTVSDPVYAIQDAEEGTEAPTALTWTNTYSTTGDLVGSTDLVVTKNFTGRWNDEWLESDSFSFTLKPSMDDEATKQAWDAKQITLAGGGDSMVVTIDDETTDYKKAFGNITFTTEGTFEFLVTENAPEEATEDNNFTVDGIKYDTSIKTVKVTVSDPNHDGTLTANVAEGSDSLTFNNTYSYPEISVMSLDLGLDGNKQITGREFEDGDSFTFTLTAGVCEDPDGKPYSDDVVDATLPEKVEDTITPDSGTSDTFSFAADEPTVDEDKFTFSKPGTYRYLIEEVNPNVSEGASGLPGVTYDGTRYRLVVTVTDNGEGKLEQTHKYFKQANGTGDFVECDEDDIVFVNRFNAQSTEIDFRAFKVLENDTMTDGEFQFRLTYAGQKANDAPEGTDFVVGENDVYPMPDGTQGEYAESASIIRGDVTFEDIAFTHDHVGTTYRYAITEVQPTEDGTMDGTPLSGAKKNDAGQWVYKGVTYDNSTKYVTARVYSEAQTINGQLTEVVRVETTGEAQDAQGGAVFTNTYDNGTGTLTGSVDLQVAKVIENRDWQDGDSFTFVLSADMSDEATKKAMDAGDITLPTNADGITLSYVKDQAADAYEVAFGDITFDEPGTYKFNIAENVNPEATNENVENGNVKYSEASDEQKAESGWTYKGVTYDNEVRSITVEVKDNGDGTMTARVTEGADTLTFTNTYKPGGDVTVGDGKTDIELSKILSGKEWSDKDEFTFTIAASEETPDAPMPETTEVTLTSDDAAKQNDETYKADFGFGPITYKAEGVYKYVVSETKGDNKGIDYAENEVTVVVTVTDNLQGGYSAAVTYENGQSFTNTYAAELDYNAEGGLNIQKTLVDHDIEGGQFAFTVTGTNDAAKALLGGDGTKVVSTKGATMGDDGNAVESIALFDDMVFEHTDDTSTDPEYTFTVKETTGGDEAAGYTNDDTEYTVTIDVIDDGEGKLTVKTHIMGGSVDETYSYDNTDAEHGTAIIPFTNTYEAKGTLGANGKVSLSATKVTNGRDMTEAEYDFKVTATSDVDQSVKEYATGTNASAADGVAGTVTFSDINYTKESLNEDASAGFAEYAKEDGKDTYTYTYTVAEATDDLADEGITATTSSFTVRVKVTDNNDGTLTVEVTYPQGSGDTLAFVNTYQTDEVPLTISGKKKIDANGWADAPTPADIEGKYKFTISGVDEDGNEAPLPDEEVAYNDASGSVTFGEIVYTLENVFGDDPDQAQTITDEAIDETIDENEGIETYAGVERSVTYTYTIEESQEVDGIDNDSAQTFKVTVTDNGKGKLTVSTDPSASSLFTFTNTYNVPEKSSSPTDGTLTLGKTLTGRDMNDGEFSFEMIGTSENAKGMKATGTNTAAADGQTGTVSLSPITFKAPGTYEFQIGEVEGDLGGVDYDTAKLTAKAEVTSDGQGNMVIDWSVYNADGDEVTEFTYGNSYTAEPTEITLGAVKVLDGRSLEEGEFTFQLKGEDGQVISEASNAADGSIQFDTIAYDKTGTYQYTVSEVEGNDETITYDDADYTITVEVTDDLKGHLSAKVAGDTVAPVFTNTYEEPVEPTEPEKPEIPQTSDTANPIIPAALAAGGAALVAGAAIWTRRRSR